jgi:hypothetical protein
MKIYIFQILLLLISQHGISQCTEPFAVPYTTNMEEAAPPALPDCMTSTYLSFSSDKIFESFGGPVDGFSGKLLSYDTAIDTPSGAIDMAASILFTNTIQLNAGVNYAISYKYGNSDGDKSISWFYVRLHEANTDNYIDVADHYDVTGANALNFTSTTFTVPSNAEYTIEFSVNSVVNQGKFYLDDIAVREADVMGFEKYSVSGFAIYPNPTSGIITIANEHQPERIEIYSLSGQLICNEPVNSLLSQVDMANFADGIYILKIYFADRVKTAKIYKE